MKKIILLAFILGLLQSSYSQTNTETTLSTLAKIDLGFQGFGLTYEPRISNSVTIDLSAGIGGGYDIYEGSLSYDYTKPALYISATPKYYYNLKQRIKKGKPVQLNSGNYIGFRFKFATPLYNKSDVVRNSILANIHWGIQRAMSNHFTLNFHAGVGYAHDVEYDAGTIYPAIDFKISYLILK